MPDCPSVDDGILDDPRLTEAGQRWGVGPYEGRVKTATKKIMAQVQTCDESTDSEGFCSCARTIMAYLQRAYDTPAPPMGEMEPTDG